MSKETRWMKMETGRRHWRLFLETCCVGIYQTKTVGDSKKESKSSDGTVDSKLIRFINATCLSLLLEN